MVDTMASMVATARCTAIRTTGLVATTEPLFFTANKSVEQTAGPTARLAQLGDGRQAPSLGTATGMFLQQLADEVIK
jgi:hypothetical protein